MSTLAPQPDPASIAAMIASAPSFGAVEIGTSVSMMLSGIATLQVWNYFRNFPDDPASVKVMVAGVYFAELLHSALVMHGTYYYTITGFVNFLTTGEPLVLAPVPWTLESSVPLVAVIVVVVQSYFCLRISRITGSRALATACWFLALLRLGFNIALTMTVVRVGSLAVANDPIFKWEIIAALSVGTFCDICIAASICVGLLRRRTGFVQSDSLIDKLVSYTVGSGAATSVIAVAELISYVMLPTRLVWLACFILISKMYSNSLLASLNQRGAHRLVSFRSQQGASASGTSTRVNFHKDPNSGMELTSVNETESWPVNAFSQSTKRHMV